MSIIVRGKDIPKHCSECDFCVNGFTDKAPMYECVASGCKTVSVLVDHDGKPFNFRPDWCPLDEIPSHGALVDVDAMLADLTKYMRMLDPESKEYSKILWIETYLNLAKNEAIIEAED